ncbi:P-loop containing nucleoside triphosphate hydrolase protein, partial [Gamsiella multidivaricata]|uniref:P-loop containing nucleoside triphosphate hydrolase protein n=1 Tax=Gamsiella multidivaricata TaxID=101098 RepID=UPI00221E3EF8
MLCLQRFAGGRGAHLRDLVGLERIYHGRGQQARYLPVVGVARLLTTNPPRSFQSSGTVNLEDSRGFVLVDGASGTRPNAVVLRDYQRDCVDKCLSKLRIGIMRQVVSLPVGTGKTVIFTHLMKRVPPRKNGGNKVLVLNERQELLYQTFEYISKHSDRLRVSIEQAGRPADLTADIIVASVQTLGRSSSPRLSAYDPKDFKCIVVDEAHHAVTKTYTHIFEHFGVDKKETEIFLVGFSATLRRHDGVKLGGAFDHISYHRPLKYMIDNAWLCPARVESIETGVDLQNVRTEKDDFIQKDLFKAVNTPSRNEAVVRAYKQYCAGRQSAVVFSADVAHAVALTKTFRKHGCHAEVITGKTSDIGRSELLKAFKERRLPIIVNCAILTEGIDIPPIDCILMAKPTKSEVLLMQMLGRGMRLYEGKEDCLVLDFVDNIKGEIVGTIPTLLGLDPKTGLSSRS